MKVPLLVCSVVVAVFLVSCTRSSHANVASRSQQLASEGAAAFNAKNYAKAQTLDAAATAINPQFAEAWVAYGMASVRLGQTDKARQAYERALSLYHARHRQNPSDANQVFQQISVLTLLGRSDEAQALLNEAHASYPDDPQITKLVGHYSELQKGWETLGVSAR